MKKVFLSYSWSNIDIANEIDDYFKYTDITIIRDVRDIPLFSSLSSFMEKIRECEYAILLISDEYLKSENCMFEITEYSHERDFSDKILPVLLDSAKQVRDLSEQINYIKYWEDKLQDTIKILENVDPLNRIEQTKRVDRIRLISQKIGSFLSIIKDKLTIDYTVLKREKYKPIFDFFGIGVEDPVREEAEIWDIKDIQERAIALEKYADKHGKDAYYYNIKGISATISGETKSAKYYYEKVLEVDPENAQALINLGNLLASGEYYDYFRAKELYQKALKIKPELPVIYNNLAVLIEDKNPARAKRYYEKALELNPGYAEAHDDLAILLSSDTYNDYLSAREHREIALKLNPNNPVIHYNYALELSKSEEIQDKINAEEHYKIAIELKPNYYEAYCGLARLLLVNSIKDDRILKKDLRLTRNIKESFEKVKVIYEEVLKINNNIAEAHLNLGSILFKLKDYYGAKRHFEKALELEPDSADCHQNYAILLASKVFNNKEEAIMHYEIAQKLRFYN